MTDVHEDVHFDDVDSHDEPAHEGGEGWATVEQMYQELAALEAHWLLYHPPRQGRTALTLLSERYRWGDSNYSPADAAEKFEKASQTVTQIHAFVKERGDALVLPRVARLIRCVRESYHMLCALSGWTDHDTAPTMTAEDMILRFSSTSLDKDKDIQIAIQFILEWTRKWGLRHREKVVYQQIIAPGGKKSRAWVPATNFHKGKDVHTLELLCRYICQKSRNIDIWKKWLNIPASPVYDKLKNCIEGEFPVLQTTRAWIAFKDGLYSIYHDLFVYYDDTRIDLPPEMAVCAYHNINFARAYLPVARGAGPIPQCIPIHNPLRDLPTPLFDMIMDTQKLCGHTKFWLMAMLGRCLHRANTFDSWQVVLYFKGRAGTGKSTLVSLLQSIYEMQDIANISNNTEGTFGLQHLTPDKLMWVAPEVKVDFNLVSTLHITHASARHAILNVLITALIWIYNNRIKHSSSH
jgi:hypothetical protein